MHLVFGSARNTSNLNVVRDVRAALHFLHSLEVLGVLHHQLFVHVGTSGAAYLAASRDIQLLGIASRLRPLAIVVRHVGCMLFVRFAHRQSLRSLHLARFVKAIHLLCTCDPALFLLR